MKPSQNSLLKADTSVRAIAESGTLGLVHNRALKVEHESIAMPEIQDLHAKVRVPGGRQLHDYVNLYIQARNPMMYKRKDYHEKLSILKISTDVLDLPGVVVSAVMLLAITYDLLVPLKD